MLKVSLSSSATGTGKLIGDPLDFKIFIKLMFKTKFAAHQAGTKI